MMVKKNQLDVYFKQKFQILRLTFVMKIVDLPTHYQHIKREIYKTVYRDHLDIEDFYVVLV